MSNEDDDIPQLCAETQAILEQFLKEREKEDSAEGNISENWQLSQFWYDDETQKVFGKLCKKLIKEKEDLNIALLSCPSLFQTVRAIFDKVKIFEYDERFKKYGEDFVHYDYNLGEDENYLKEFSKAFDVIILDPPFLSQDCLTKSFKIVNNIKKDDALIILNTGSVQRDLALEHGLKEMNFKPKHKNNLANDFSCFTNFDMDRYL